jgi:exosortase/archaeosortase family protein
MFSLSTINRHTTFQRRAANTALGLGAVVLAWEPAVWLVGTWYQNGYDGIGWVAFALALGLAAWSLSSPVVGAKQQRTQTYLLLLATAVLRMVAQLLDVNVIGALLLAVDVYAIASLLHLERRKHSISPFWLAIVFCFSLPVEPIVQRLVGFDLQHVSAFLACGLLQPFFDQLSCTGVRLQINAVDVLVDLPCSGAELVSLSALIFSVINAFFRPGTGWGVLGILVCLVLALLGNGVRIALLAAGISHAEALPFNVMDVIPHTIIGLVMVSITCIALLSFARLYPEVAYQSRPVNRPPKPIAASLRLWIAGLFLPMALMIGALQPRPVDASPRLSTPEIPLVAAGFLRVSSDLTTQEQRYFTRYGGGAERASFGPYGLLLVSTASPLRHLHDPTICLSGMGYQVNLLGTDHKTVSTVYQAERALNAGEFGNNPVSYLVRVSYFSNRGVIASSVSEVVWHWLRQPDSKWTMVQRIVPQHPAIDTESAELWESAMRRAFNLS